MRAGSELLDAGHCPFVPHTTSTWHMIHPHGYEVWMDWDFKWILQCEALVRLPGVSPGSDREVDHAKGAGLPVFHSVAEFLEWHAKHAAVGAN